MGIPKFIPCGVNEIHISYDFRNAGTDPFGSEHQPMQSPTMAIYLNMHSPGVILSSCIGADGPELRTTSEAYVKSSSVKEVLLEVLRMVFL